jgi:hypothetical protein
MNSTAPWDDAQIVYVTQHDGQAAPDEQVEHDEAPTAEYWPPEQAEQPWHVGLVAVPEGHVAEPA